MLFGAHKLPSVEVAVPTAHSLSNSLDGGFYIGVCVWSHPGNSIDTGGGMNLKMQEYLFPALYITGLQKSI